MSTKKKKKSKMKEDVEETTRTNCIVHFPEIKEQTIVALTQEKLENVKRIAELRKRQSVGSTGRYIEVCEKVPDTLHESDGYHRQCYRKFSRHLDRLAVSSNDTSEDLESKKPIPRNIQSGDKIKFTKTCIFCTRSFSKTIKIRGLKTSEKLTGFRRNSWQKVVEHADARNDEKLLKRIRGYDLYASEAKFHSTCRTSYMNNTKKWKSLNEEAKMSQSKLEEVHETAFDHLIKVIEEKIIRLENVMKLTDLREIYVKQLENTEYRNDDYRSEKLKKKKI